MAAEQPEAMAIAFDLEFANLRHEIRRYLLKAR